jgi:hypothetical protein
MSKVDMHATEKAGSLQNMDIEQTLAAIEDENFFLRYGHITTTRVTDDDLKALAAHVRKLTEALQVYANEDKWLCDYCDSPNTTCTPDRHRLATWDGSSHGPQIARAALQEANNE